MSKLLAQTPRAKSKKLAKAPHGTGHARIRKAAEDLLIEKDGILDIAELAKRAGVASSLLYRYYPSKNALLAAIVENFYDRYDQVVFKVPNDPAVGYAAGIRRRLEQMVLFHYSEPLAATVLCRLGSTADVAIVELKRIESHIDAAAAQVRQGQRLGELPGEIDPEVAGAVVIGGTHQALARVLTREKRPSPEWLTGELWRAFSPVLHLSIFD